MVIFSFPFKLIVFNQNGKLMVAGLLMLKFRQSPNEILNVVNLKLCSKVFLLLVLWVFSGGVPPICVYSDFFFFPEICLYNSLKYVYCKH